MVSETAHLSNNSGMTCGMFNKFLVTIRNLKSVKEFHLNGSKHTRVFGGRVRNS